MEQVINNLLGRYERGALSRRELVGALAVVALTNQSASAAGFESSTLNHVSITVSNLQRSVEFYRNVFGLPVQSEN
ncbi:MAG TPA: VOC family protein, partial [Micropepsaceae bacterium]|nr:VOC family protein [Micropepsaceae bacterium]